MERFWRKNLFSNISVEQFKDTAIELVDALNSTRSDLETTLSLTTNGDYYHWVWSLTVITDKTESARQNPDNQPEILSLDELNQELWNSAYSRDLSIHLKDDTPYMICLSNEARHEDRLLFYGQALDCESEKIYKSFNKKDRILQILDDGFPETSLYAVAHAMESLGKY